MAAAPAFVSEARTFACKYATIVFLLINPPRNISWGRPALGYTVPEGLSQFRCPQAQCWGLSTLRVCLRTESRNGKVFTLPVCTLNFSVARELIQYISKFFIFFKFFFEFIKCWNLWCLNFDNIRIVRIRQFRYCPYFLWTITKLMNGFYRNII